MGVLFRPAWRAVLAIRNPHCHGHRLLPFFISRNLNSESETSSLGQPKAVWDGHESSGRDKLPDSSQVLTGPSKIVAGREMRRQRHPLKHHRQVTLQAENPRETSQQQVLTSLHGFCATRTHWQESAKDWDQAVVILATPSFANWLEDDSFIKRFLDTITQSTAHDEKVRANAEWSKKSQKEPGELSGRFQVNVVCACVDGLSTDIDSMPYMIGRGADEGFSVLQGRKGRTFVIHGNAWEAEDSTTGKYLAMASSLTFTNAQSAQDPSQVVLPLANTLFSNGRHSTLLISKWELEKGHLVKVKSSERRNQAITVFDGPGLGQHCLRVPAAPLTPARRIVSGLGNIVKQIDFGEANPGPASRELEASINEYLSQTQREKSTIAVWALIVPKSSISNQQPPPPYELLSDKDHVRLQWQVEPSNPDFIGHWLSQGAKFCRVLSGGGGWGAKQGLLSLDPQSAFKEISEPRLDFSTGSVEDQQTSALGNIAEPGSLIQFFVVDNRVPKAPPPTPSFLAELQRSELWPSSTVFGTVASTVDDKKTAQTDYGIGNEVICHPGLFGAVSESGIFLDFSPSRAQKNSEETAGIIGTSAMYTKLDLPYSYIYTDTRGEVKELLQRQFARIWRQTKGRKHRKDKEKQLKLFMRKHTCENINGLPDSTNESDEPEKSVYGIDSDVEMLFDFKDESKLEIVQKKKKKKKRKTSLISYRLSEDSRCVSSEPSDQPDLVEPTFLIRRGYHIVKNQQVQHLAAFSPPKNSGLVRKVAPSPKSPKLSPNGPKKVYVRTKGLPRISWTNRNPDQQK